MFHTQHDITAENVDEAVVVLQKMLAVGNKVLIVSKPTKPVVEQLCQELAPFKEQVLFRFTIGSLFNDTLRFWEPGAPGFLDRLVSLEYAYKAGFATSVSMEPLLEEIEDDVMLLVHLLEPYVTDCLWIGKANKLVERLTENGYTAPEHMEAARKLIESQSDERIKALYERLKNNPNIRWKDSIKQVVGLDIPPEIGMDV